MVQVYGRSQLHEQIRAQNAIDPPLTGRTNR
jgi:hypothetical protein